jgi:hypothetical protein
MAVEFNGGGAQATPGFEGYCERKQWNDRTLLFPPTSIATLDRNNQWLQAFNTEAIIKRMLANVPKASKARGYFNTVREWVEAPEEVASIIVLKGLHQWKDGYTKAHISIGYDGYIWHLYARYHGEVRPQTMKLNGDITSGDFQADETHDHYNVKKNKRQRRHGAAAADDG